MDNTPDSDEAAAQWLLGSDEPTAPAPEAGDPPSDEAAPDEDAGATALDAEADDNPASDVQEDEQAAPEEEAEFFIDYRANGEDRRATLAEAKQKLALADGAHARMQQAAEREKAAEAFAASLQSQFQPAMAAVQEVLTYGLKPAPQRPDPRLAQSNPAAYQAARAQYEAKLDEYNDQQARLQHARALQAQMAEAQQRKVMEEHQARLVAEAERLAQIIPEFANPDTAAKTRERLLKAGHDYGFTADELEGIADARMIAVLRDAAELRAIKARAREAKTPLPAPTPRHVAPAAKPAKEPAHLAYARQRKTALASGSMDALAALLLTPKP